MITEGKRAGFGATPVGLGGLNREPIGGERDRLALGIKGDRLLDLPAVALSVEDHGHPRHAVGCKDVEELSFRGLAQLCCNSLAARFLFFVAGE
jgi:hypothetical protein